MVKDWLSFCDSYHKKLCKANFTDLGLTVIDCEQRRMTNLPFREPYLTLSYVWGCGRFSWDDRFSLLPAKMEATIEDAMSVVITLGFRFLWVDRYCIPQHDLDERHSQIQQMGEIYAQSSLTIIAIAGEGPDHGLPGVSSTHRVPSDKLRSPFLDPVTIPPNIEDEYAASKWRSRGWTYQEGLLARRRLLFTDSQVYFQCAGMHCQESLSIPLACLHIKDWSKFKDEYIGIFPHLGIGETSLEILDRIEEYVHREFTYPSDALDAFQGVFRAFQSLSHPVRQVCGIVILDPRTWPSTKSFTIEDMLVLGLCWGFYGPDQIDRQPHFPSWTWLGWKAGRDVKFDMAWRQRNVPLKILATATIEVKPGVVERVDKSPWGTVGATGHPSVLVLKAWTFPLKPVNELSQYAGSWSASKRWYLEKRDGRSWKDLHIFAVEEFKLLGQLGPADTCDVSLVVLGHRGECETLLMLVRYVEDRQAYERLPYHLSMIGLIRIDGDGVVRSMQDFEPEWREIRLI
ncbi:hypothetical protein FKW77_004599 [Venturia effusa]|uniref:Heterokaryon incompatibility domain-containing protein n=1 Tax=Venturia effusa TaxID=50376 RepID=A0A517LNT3_9PEZI|nr:hypothetical protein FKW77_004599 [Venturia effusa]